MLAEIVTIGDELTRGEIVDTNAAGLAARLWALGVPVRWMTSCRDDDDDIRAALTAAVGRAGLVLVSGGLGPTEDDRTVDVVAGLLGVGVAHDPVAQARLEAMMAARGRPVTEVNLRQVREDAERAAVLKVIARTNGNIARAAEILGVSRPSLYDLLGRFGLKKENGS